MQCVLCASQTSISFLVFIWCSVWLFEVITRMVWAISNYSTLTLKCAKLLYIILFPRQNASNEQCSMCGPSVETHTVHYPLGHSLISVIQQVKSNPYPLHISQIIAKI